MFKGPVSYNLKHADVVYSLGGKLTDILRSIVPKEKISVIPIAIEDTWIRQDAKNFEEENLKRGTR